MRGVRLASGVWWLFRASACLLILVTASPLSGQSSAPGAVGLLITEVYYDAAGQDELGEWVEIANLGDADVELAGYKLSDAATPSSREGTVAFPAGVVVAPGQAVVVARSAAGFGALFGMNPALEVTADDPGVPEMEPYAGWGSDEFALANDGDEVLLLDRKDRVVDAVNYGDQEGFFHPSVAGVVTGQSIERSPAHCDSDSAADWLPRDIPTPGMITIDGECRAPADPAADVELLSVGEIQGERDISPFINQTVSFVARVTGAISDRNTQGATFHTLFVQSPPGQEDGNPATSDGMALFLGTAEPRFVPGDDILVTGQVTEFFGYTEIDNNGLEMTLLSRGNPLLPAARLDTDRMIEERADYLETLESMWVSYPHARVVGPTLDICSITVLPATTPYTRVMEGEPLSLLLDVLHTSDTDCTAFPQLKVGDEVDGLSGPLIYHFDEFKLALQRPAELTIQTAPMPEPPAAPALTPNQFSAATFNLHDHFDSSPDPGAVDTPAPSPAEVSSKRAKLANAIAGPLGCPTLLAVQEVENLSLLEDLAAMLWTACGFPYVIAHLESPDDRGIDLALLGDSRRVTMRQVALSQTCSRLDTGISDGSIRCRAGWSPLFSRPPLVIELSLDDHPLTIIVNHFKSRREGEEETAPLRLAQAQHVAQLVAEQLQALPETLIIVMGDFNDGPGSATLQALTGTGRLQDGLMGVEAESRYSYIFSGLAELLDGILLSPAAARLLVGADIAHVNADYPAGWAEDVQLVHRSSDHDIPLVILELPAMPTPIAATPETLTASPESSAPAAAVSTEERGPTAGNLPTYLTLAGCVTLGLAAIGALWILRRRSQATA